MWPHSPSCRRVEVISFRQCISTPPVELNTTRIITFSMSPSWLSPPSLDLLFLPLPLSLASMEPHRSAGDTGRRCGPSDVLAGALMMRRLLVYMMILPKSNTEDWRTQIKSFFLKFDFPWVDNLRLIQQHPGLGSNSGMRKETKSRIL